MKRRRTPGRPVVLIVEDEPLVRSLEVDILQEAGFRVIEAKNADEAFELLKRRPDVKVVFTDVDMPGSIDGFEFARLVAQGWPEVGVVVTSGKTAPGPGDMPEGAAFMRKPYRSDDVVRQVRRMVGSVDGEAE